MKKFKFIIAVGIFCIIIDALIAIQHNNLGDWVNLGTLILYYIVIWVFMKFLIKKDNQIMALQHQQPSLEICFGTDQKKYIDLALEDLKNHHIIIEYKILEETDNLVKYKIDCQNNYFIYRVGHETAQIAKYLSVADSAIF